MSDLKLLGRTALVTGSSRGIGAAIARRLAAEGARLILHASADPARAKAVADAIRAQGGEAAIVLGDLASSDAPVRIVQEAFAVHGRLDILVCNAGCGGGGQAVDASLEVIDRCIAVNLRASILATAEFGRLTQSSVGRVVMITSGAATHPAFGSSIYAAAKAGAEAFARSVAQEFGARGITVNSVAPGPTRTDMIAGIDLFEKVPPWTALRRLGAPEDIADIVAFVVSDDARWLTGVTLAANGGLVTSAANVINYA